MKKGFTLVELLGAIVVLALLSLVAFPAVTKTVKSNKQKLYNTQLENIKSSAKAWGADNISKLPDSGCIYITLDTLKEAGFVENNIKDPRNNSELTNILVKITVEGNSYNYEVIADNITPSCTLTE